MPNVNLSDRRPRIGVNLLALMPDEVVTGTGRYIQFLLKALVLRDRFDLILFCPQGRSEWDLNPPVVEIVSVPKLRNVFARTAYEQTVFPVVAMRHDIDLLFSPNYVSPLWGAFKRVFTIHDMYAWQIPWSMRRGTRINRRLMVPASIVCSHAVIAVSINTAEDVRRAVPMAARKLRVIHEACTLDADGLYREQENSLVLQTQPFVLMVANVTPNKDIETVAAAAVLLRDRGRTCPTYVVGRDSQGLMARAIVCNDATGVLVPLGEVDDRTLRAYYRHALCTVHASAYEGFGLPVLEAQALGSPVVCTRRGALPEVAGDGALYFDYGDSAQLVRAIEFLMDNPREREALISRGVSNVRRFSWDRAAEETEALFMESLSLR